MGSWLRCRHNFEYRTITGASGIMFDTVVRIYKVDKSRRPDFPPLISFFFQTYSQPHPESGSLITGTPQFNTTGHLKYEIQYEKKNTNIKQNKMKTHGDNQLLYKC